MLQCNKCSYSWESRVETPKACPRCKTRLDFLPKKIKTIKMEVQ